MVDGTVSTLAVKTLDEASFVRWDAFVEACEGATFFHRAGWKRVIEDSFGHRCYYLFAEAEGEIRGVLPLVHVNSRIFSNALISNAFCAYGGPIATAPEVCGALDRAAMDLASALKVDHLEYRLKSPMHADWACNTDLYATFRKALDPKPDANLLAIPRKQRAVIRKSLTNELVAELDDSVDRFFPIYAESVRNLGTPVFPKALFANLKREFGHDCEVLTVTHQSNPVTALVSFYFRDEVLPYYGGGLPAARSLGAFDFMYWDLMRRACERGYRMFDFGRSKQGTGAFAFKTHWGFQPEPLCYEYKLVRAKEMPSINPLNPKYQPFIATWKRLPLPIANVVGPWIARQLG